MSYSWVCLTGSLQYGHFTGRGSANSSSSLLLTFVSKLVTRHLMKQGSQKKWPFFSLQAHHWVSFGRSVLVSKQMQHVGTLLLQKSSSIPERVELISPELLELSERFWSMTVGNRISLAARFFEGITSVDDFWNIDEREGEPALKSPRSSFLSTYLLISWRHYFLWASTNAFASGS